jgi:8-oxo-dGTP diphosphatase
MADQSRLVSTAKAAAAVGVDRTTLFRWWQAKKVTTPYRTPSGHLRWVIADLQAQLANPTPPQEDLPMPLDDPSAPQKPSIATAIVVSELGVLVGKRNDGTPPWTFIAGQAHDGEPIADAAVREVKEETGLVVVAGGALIGRRTHPKTGRDMHYVACRPTEGTDVFVGDEEELAEVRWVPTVDALCELMQRDQIFPPVLEHLERVLPG